MATVLTPQQPELRPFVVYDRTPAGCMPFLIANDDTAPLLRPGDVVLIDTRQREPIHRELFVIDYQSGPKRLRRNVVELFSKVGRFGGGKLGEHRERAAWYLGAYNRPRSAAEGEQWVRQGRPLRMVDGPLVADHPPAVKYLRNQLIGLVVGILQPRFAEPLRQIGGAA